MYEIFWLISVIFSVILPKMEGETRQPISDYVVISSLKVSKGKCSYLQLLWVWNKKLNGSIKNCLFSPKEWIFIQSIAYDNDHWHWQPISKKFFSVKRGNLTFENSSLIVGYSTVTEIINERSMYVMTNIMDAI